MATREAQLLSALLRAAVSDAALAPTLTRIGIDVTNQIKGLLSSPGSGRVYRRHGTVHQASAPGQPPAVDTGRLRASYTWQLGRDAKGPFVEVGTGVEYAPFLEFGTSKMAARPHVRPAIAASTGNIARLIAQGIGEAERKIAATYPRVIEVKA